MSILDVCKNAARLIGIAEPTSLIGSSNVHAKKLLEALCMAADLRLRQYAWPQLVRTHTVTLESGVSTYSIPADFLSIINNTQYDVDGSRPMEGPLSHQEWANLQYGVTNVGPYMKFRIAGRTNKRFQISPTPGASGAEVAFYYRSNIWVLPADWTASTSYLAGNYASNTDGLIYMATTSGTSGSTEPTHTTGTASDGGVTWQVYTGAYTRPMFDTDEPLFDENLLKDDVVWCFRQLDGMDFEVFKAAADAAWSLHYVQVSGAPTIHLGGSDSDSFLLTYDNVPDTGYGL